MKVTKVYYKRLFSMPDYQNKEVGVEIELESGEKEEHALEVAMAFVDNQDPKKVEEIEEKQRLGELKMYENIISNACNYSEDIVVDAAKKIREIKYQDLPF